MAVVAMKQLLEAGVHFGHQTRRWDPKMAEYIFQARNGIHIIDLQKTSKKLDEAYAFIKEQVEEGKTVLFVGTKKQAQDCMKEAAQKCGMYYVNQRWLGGMLTNFGTIQKRIQRLKDLETMEQDGTFDVLPKKEVILLKKEMDKLERNLGGIKDMEKLPGVIFLIDPKKEKIAVLEAKKLEIPVGCVIVKDGKIISRGHNLKESKQDTTKHAEIIAIQKASKKLQSWRLIDCEMYITLEPCAMCAGAIINSRIKKIYIGTMDEKTGVAGSVFNLFEDYVFNHKVEIETGVMQEECKEIIKHFFKELRELKKDQKTKENL